MAIRQRIFSHLLSLSVDFFERRRVGELISRAASDTDVIRQLGTALPMNVLRQSITVVVGVILITAFNVRLAFVLFAFLPIMALVTHLSGRIVRRFATQAQDNLARANSVYEETLSGIRTVKAMAREDYEIGRYGTWLERVFGSAMRRAVASTGMHSTVTLLFFGAMATILWYATNMLRAGELDAG